MPHISAREPEGSMDSRGATGGETEAVDRRGQDHARYATATSDVKGHNREGERAGRGERGRGGRDGGERVRGGAERGREGGREGERRGEGGREGGERGARGGGGGERGARGGVQTRRRPLSPYLFILVLSVLMHDVYSLFEQFFHYTPWTFSARTPVTAIEYADDTVLMAHTQLALHRLLHTLQHEACKRGLSLNPDKCQLLRLRSHFPIHLSPCSPRSCSHCSGTTPFGPQIHPINSAKCLGAYISANGSSDADCNYRYSQ